MADADIRLSCPICFERYSDKRYPVVAPWCGHSICRPCAVKRNQSLCVTCQNHNMDTRGITWSSSSWLKNFGLLDVVNLQTATQEAVKRLAHEREQLLVEKKENAVLLTQFRSELAQISHNHIGYMECPKCHTMEKRERMKICETCAAEKWSGNWKEMEEELILPLILCAFCCQEEHGGHRSVNYLPWKLESLFSSTITSGTSAVCSMDDLCASVIEKGKEQLGKWNEKMDSLRAIDCKTYRDGLAIVDTLTEESDIVCRASEDTLPTLRIFAKKVTDSISRLNLLSPNDDADDKKKGEEDESKKEEEEEPKKGEKETTNEQIEHNDSE